MAVTNNITTIPAARVPLIEERTGLISREWYRYLNNQYTKTGQKIYFVTPEDYGGVGNGLVDDSASVQSALDSGYPVYLPPDKIYVIAKTLTMSTPNQWFGGPGVLRIFGAINGLELISPTSTIVTGIELDLTFNSPDQTAGWAIYIKNSSRVKINKLNIINGFGGLYVQQANWVVVDFMWASLTGPGVKWYGNDSTRSDLLILNAVVVDTGDEYYGMDWDGNCHSLTVKYLGIVGGKGMIIRNSDGLTTFPAIGRIGQVEVDYSTGIGVEIQAGLDYDFVMPYVLGAASDGFRIAATINAYEVRITGGKSIGNGGYGINNLGGILLYAGDTSLYSNSLGEINGSVWNKTPRQAIDDDFYLTTGGGNPLIAFATNDYLAYDRTANQLNFQINGVGTISFSGAATQSYVPVYATGLRLLGSTSGYTGFVPDAAGPAVTYKLPTAVGTINQVLSTDGLNNLFWASVSGGGGVTSVGVTSPVVNTGTSTAPVIAVNATSGNTPYYLVQRNDSGDFSANYITANGFYVDSYYYARLSGDNPNLVFDNNDYLSYDRTGNQYNFQIDGNGIFSLSSTATQTYKPLLLMGSTSGYVGFTVPASAGGTTYTLPSSDGSKNQFLKTNGSSTLSWAYSNNIVTPEDFGATGNGTTDDSAAFQAAINSGFDVYLLPNSIYAIGTTLVMSKANQSVGGPGVIKIVGAINGIKLTSLTSTIITGVQLDLTFDSPTQTAGWAVYIDNSSRVKINKLNILHGFGGLYVQVANTVVVDFMWASLTGPGIKWYGNDTTRSDILILNSVVVDPGDTEYGMDWDGNCHTLTVKYLGIVGGKGMIIRNTAGVTTFPAIGRIGQVEVDYSTGIGVEIQAGLDYDFVMPYVLGSASDGFKIASTINAYEVRIIGGKSIGNGGYGINNLGGALLYGGATSLYSNASGETNGVVWNKAPRQAIDDNFYLTTSSNSPELVFDTTDYLSYDRTNNQLNFQIAAAGIFKMSSIAIESYKPFRILGSTTGYVEFNVPATAGSTTYTWPISPTNGYFLQTDSTGNLSWAAASGGTGVSTVSVASANGLAGTSSGGSNPILTLSTSVTGLLKGNGTAISAATSGTDYVGSVSVTTPVVNLGTSTAPNIAVNATSSNTALYLVQRNASGDFSANYITATGFYANANYYMQMSGTNPNLVFDTTDYLAYDRTANQYNFQIAGNGIFSLSATATQTYKPLRIMGSTSGYVGFTVPAVAGSATYTLPSADGSVNQVLSTNGAGTLSWATVSGGGGVTSVGVTAPVVNTGTSSAPIIGVNSSSSNTANYLVRRDANGDFTARYITATAFYADTNYYMTIVGAAPVLSFDSTDYISYDRTNNQYNFQIAGNGVFALNATATQTYKPLRIQGVTSGYVGFNVQAIAGSTTYTWPAAPTNTYFLRTDATGNLSWALPPTGVTSVTATSPVASSGGTTPNISISQATSTTSGYLSSTDWSTFNNKQPSGTYVTSVGAASPVVSSGGTTPSISVNAASANTVNYLVQRDGSGNFSAGTITATQFTVGANYYQNFSGTNPQQVWSATSSVSYDRTNDQLNTTISGIGVFKLASTYAQSLKPFVLPAYTVATLPLGIQGAMAYVTDASAPAYNTTVVGGGSSVVRVFFDGTSWKT